MEPEPRTSAFITVTSLAKYLAYDEKACGLAAWFPAHYTYKKPPFDNASYLLDHAALLSRLATQVKDDGYCTAVEEDNGFIARGRVSGTKVAGTPDLVALNLAQTQARIFDVKTGTPRREHVVQVRLYMLFARWLPLLAPAFARNVTPQTDGIVVYRSGAESYVPPLDEEFRAQVRGAVAALGDTLRMSANPSLSACAFCTVPGCTSRFDADVASSIADDIFQ